MSRGPNAPTRLAFGFGPRYCVGATLARQEMLTFLSQLLLDRLDNIELAEPPARPRCTCRASSSDR